MMNNTLYLDSPEKTEEYLKSLERKNIRELAVDIEGEFNLHRYGEHLCLVQIFDGTEYALIDPLVVPMDLVKSFFENSAVDKIMYDCSSDRTLLFRQYGITLASVSDLLPAVELLEYEKRGLGNVLSQTLQIEEKPKKKFQQYDWMIRPIDAEALEYALDDVKYLFELKRYLFSALSEKGLMEEYWQRNEEIRNRKVSMEHTPGLFKKNRFLRMPEKNRKLMRSLFDIRDGYARQLNLPPDRVVANELLFRLAGRQMKAGEIRFSGKVGREMAEAIREEFRRRIGT
jgi:ribonuclease D